MPLILVIVAFVVLRYFEIGPFASISWWWLAGLMALAFLWFEFGEHMLGLDKRRAHEQLEKMRSERVKRTFRDHPGKR